MGVLKTAAVQPEKNRVLRLARTIFPVSNGFDGDKFLTWTDGRRVLTPLALVLLMVETTDLIFAVDSIPAVFAVTQKPFIVFTSNIFAILGLRSLYFALAGAHPILPLFENGPGRGADFRRRENAGLPLGACADGSLPCRRGRDDCAFDRAFRGILVQKGENGMKFHWTTAPPQPALCARLSEDPEYFASAGPVPCQSRFFRT